MLWRRTEVEFLKNIFYIIAYWDGERWGLAGWPGTREGGGGGDTMIVGLFSELGK